MAGTREGGLKAARKNREYDPDFYKRIGKLGGSKSWGGGFHANLELAQAAGRAGGQGAGKKYQCTECGKEFSEHFIDYHMESKHPQPQTEVAQQLAQIESKSSWVDRLRFWQ